MTGLVLTDGRFSEILYDEVKTEWDKHYMDCVKELQEKEAALHFTLADFADMVKTQGIAKVMSDMDEDTFWQLYKWMGDNYSFEYKQPR